MDPKNSRDEREIFTDYEKVYLRMSKAFAHINKEHWGLHCVCGVKYTARGNGSIEDALPSAWAQLLLEYPGLGTRSDEFHKDEIDLSDNEAIAKWLKMTFFVESSLSADDIISTVEPRDVPSLYYLQSSSEVLFLSQHWRTDALGCCMLLDRLFELLSTDHNNWPAKASMNNSASPAMEIAAGAIEMRNPEIQEYARSYIDAFHAKAIHSGGLPYNGDATTPPKRTRHKELVLTQDETREVVKLCKKNGISVSAASHVALAKTVLSHTHESRRSKGYTTVMAVNMRPYLPPPYNSRAHACQTYVASVTPTVAANTTFLDSARMLTHEYQNWCTPNLLRSLRWIYRYHYQKLFGPRDPSVQGNQPPPSGVTLSSLGVVERQFQGEYGPDLSVTTFRFGVSMMTRQMLLYAWTFKGQLTFSLDYNEAYHSETMAREVLDQVKQHILEGCGVIAE